MGRLHEARTARNAVTSGALPKRGDGRINLRSDFPHEESKMKENIHPTTFKAKMTCACGYEAEALSTKGEVVNVEICSQCHPFYTGKQRFVDTAGRIDRFRKKYAKFGEGK